jgi:predicted nucleic acid-binding Zn ribbon protein
MEEHGGERAGRGMEHIKSHLEGLAAGLLRGLNEEDRVMAAWPHVCGPQAAEHARAVGYSRGVLLLDVDEREWLTTLRQLQGEYCARIRALTGVVVKDLDFFEKRKAAGESEGPRG